VTTSPLVFSPGTTTLPIEVMVKDDGLDEWAEDLILELGAPTNATTVGTPTHSFVVNDNDPEPLVMFDPDETNGSASEGDTNISYDYRVVLSAASGKQITVPISEGGNSDLDDYTIRQGDLPVVFLPGEMAHTIRITVIGDTMSDQPQSENIVLTIDAPVNAVLGIPSSRTHTIVDDEP
jgi:hypothetical protein